MGGSEMGHDGGRGDVISIKAKSLSACEMSKRP